MVIDPWDNKEIIMFTNILEKKINNEKINVLVNGQYIIKGPFSSSNNKRYEIEFNYYYDSNQMCGVLNTINKTNSYNNISLKLFKDIATVDNISSSTIYRGSEYMLLSLQLIYKLGYKKSRLQDLAYFSCDRKMNFFTNNPVSKKMDVYNKLIYLFRFGGTFYMPFGYKPVIKKSEMNIFNLK